MQKAVGCCRCCVRAGRFSFFHWQTMCHEMRWAVWLRGMVLATSAKLSGLESLDSPVSLYNRAYYNLASLAVT